MPFAQSLYTKGQGVKDIEGNEYPSIIIHGQEWMQKNLAVSKYRNGDPILTGLNDAQWDSTTTGAYTIYDDVASNNTTYGKLYNWYAVSDSRGLCPTGWHVPSDDDWSALINYLDPNAAGGDTFPNVAGDKMKSTGTLENADGLWYSYNKEATNESGFTGFPCGVRDVDGPYGYVGDYGYWWSSTVDDSNAAQQPGWSLMPAAWARSLNGNDSSVLRYGASKQVGFSVRCVRD